MADLTAVRNEIAALEMDVSVRVANLRMLLDTPLPPPPPPSDRVVYVSPEVEAICGPQLVSGSVMNPWPWFDRNAVERGPVHAAEFPMESLGDEMLEVLYYDQGLVQYLNYYRTGDPVHSEGARKVAGRWAEAIPLRQEKGWGTTPRGASLGGLILYALDGHPEIWPVIEGMAYYNYRDYVYKVRNLLALYNVRDGAYALLHVAWLAQVHPDVTKRAAYKQQAIDGALGYFVRLQDADGGFCVIEDGRSNREQPFMVGLLLEALVAVHQISGDEQVLAAILKSVERLWNTRHTGIVPEERGRGVSWRAVPYFVFPVGTTLADGSLSTELTVSPPGGLAGGWDTNTIREHRQRNSLVIHAFGYAYHVTKDPKYREWGDEFFAATYGKDEGPGADFSYGLADFRAKEYNQAYRSAGRYLAWRVD